MDTKNSYYKQNRDNHRTPKQSDNNNGTLGKEGGLPRRRVQKPFELQNRTEDLISGNKEYDRHHKSERTEQIRPVSAEEEKKKGEINDELPGNRSGNTMVTHAENTGGNSAED